MDDESLHYFEPSVESIKKPERFTWPFNYEPHPLAELAASLVQDYLSSNEAVLGHDFGLGNNPSPEALGKMFGVLVVETDDQRLAFLAAYSGKLGGKNSHQWFVSPIVDLLDPEGFYRKGEEEVSAFNREISILQDDAVFIALAKQERDLDNDYSEKLSVAKRLFKEGRRERKALRNEVLQSSGKEAFEGLMKEHEVISHRQQYEIKSIQAEYNEKREALTQALKPYQTRLNGLKKRRSSRSAALQEEIFKRFSFLNALGMRENLRDIFTAVPPAGAGECAAPRLLNHAYTKGYRPLCMAEFWWGMEPKSEVRHHRSYYPACRSKCEPILTFMMQGLSVDPDPMASNESRELDIEILYEDEAIAVINKPPGLLTVPGKKSDDSLYSRVKKRYPESEGPLIVHRLDLSTSGIVIIAKNKEAHAALQEQFESRSVMKRYVALLDGELREESGTVKLPLRVDLDNRPQQLVCFEHGKQAVTKWKLIARENGRSRVHFFLLTGRTHQLRVHAAHHLGLGAPIVGDELYGKRGGRLCLHADYLRIVHPVSGRELSFSCEAEF